MQIIENGILSFGRSFRFVSTSIRDLDFFHSESILAPYWTDLGISRGGDIFYRMQNGSESVDLQYARNLIQENFPDVDFQPTDVVVITWYQVPHNSIGVAVNTFQVVLVYNQEISFTLFFYDETNVPSSSVVVGFSPSFLSGSIEDSFMIPRSDTDNIERNTNTGRPGFYAYRVDSNNITEPRGNCRILHPICYN